MLGTHKQVRNVSGTDHTSSYHFNTFLHITQGVRKNLGTQRGGGQTHTVAQFIKMTIKINNH